jgi:hypothetical protein
LNLLIKQVNAYLIEESTSDWADPRYLLGRLLLEAFYEVFGRRVWIELTCRYDLRIGKKFCPEWLLEFR